MEFRGVPLHPLVVHAAVVLVPFACVSVIAFVLPRWRWLARWPALLLTLAAAGAVQLAVISGENLEETRGLHTPLVHTHHEWGQRLQVAMWVLAGVMVVAFLVLPHVTRLVGGRNREAKVAALTLPLMVLLPVLVVIVLALVVITGDYGARAVWS